MNCWIWDTLSLLRSDSPSGYLALCFLLFFFLIQKSWIFKRNEKPRLSWYTSISILVYLNARLSQGGQGIVWVLVKGAKLDQSISTWLNIEQSILQFKIILSYSRIIGLNAILILLCSKLLILTQKSSKFNKYLSLFNSQYA